MTTENRLILQSRLEELARVWPWLESLASRYKIPGKTQFAMNVCLEEALSNIIRHGYSNERPHSVTVEFANPQTGYFIFIVEDQAPPFNPVDAPELSVLDSFGEVRMGGHGIRLLKGFADTLEYRRTPNGNQLRIGFTL